MRPINEGMGITGSGMSVPPPNGQPATGPRILVVDDEPQIRELVAQALRRDGYRVSIHEDGHTALEEIQGGEISVLLTDLKMPRMSGLELIRSAKDLAPNMGSILITAFSSTETAVQALRYGADDYLTKPFRLEDLRGTVERVLAERRIAGHERDAVQRVRTEATALRRRQLEVERALREAEESLRLSRRDLERRVTDLEFIREVTGLLSRKGDLQRMLHTTAAILNRRFRADVTRIELELGDGVHVVEHPLGAMPRGLPGAMGPDLLRRARGQADGTVADVVLGYGRPLEGLAAHVEVGGRTAGGITILRTPSPDPDEVGDRYLLSLVPQALSIAVESELNRQAAESNALEVALGILEVLEGRGSLFAGHANRVSRTARRMADALGLSPRLQSVIETAARLHDVGEVGIPDGVLTRDGPLSEAERSVVRTHPVVGAQILAPFGEAAAFVRHHHERPDGLGYPDGLRGDEIPLGAGIIGVAEAYDAMTSPRPYRRSRSRREALAEIERLRGTQFVEPAVDGLLAVMQATG